MKNKIARLFVLILCFIGVSFAPRTPKVDRLTVLFFDYVKLNEIRWERTLTLSEKARLKRIQQELQGMYSRVPSKTY